MNKLSNARRAQIVRVLVEGNSVRATCRITDTAKGTVLKLLNDLGHACDAYQDEHLRNLKCQRLQLDEIWSFVGIKERNRPADERGKWGRGDIWTWTAIDADTKLIPCWLIGPRDARAASTFLGDLASRLVARPQITTDGHRVYLDAVDEAFGNKVDYAMLVKLYGQDAASEARYSPPVCIGTRETVVCGDPDPAHVSTSYAERANLTMRMGIRRMTRLTNAFSKRVEGHAAAVALHFCWYNFCRVHQTLRTTPAQAAGVTDKLWDAEDIVALLD